MLICLRHMLWWGNFRFPFSAKVVFSRARVSDAPTRSRTRALIPPLNTYSELSFTSHPNPIEVLRRCKQSSESRILAQRPSLLIDSYTILRLARPSYTNTPEPDSRCRNEVQNPLEAVLQQSTARMISCVQRHRRHLNNKHSHKKHQERTAHHKIPHKTTLLPHHCSSVRRQQMVRRLDRSSTEAMALVQARLHDSNLLHPAMEVERRELLV